MHSARTAKETLELLWHNYQALAEEIDFEAMDPERVAKHRDLKPPVRPFRIAAWLGMQAFLVSAWSLWEYYSRSLCNSLDTKTKKDNGDSHVDWVRKSLAANNVEFPRNEWFASANCLRILIAHYGGRAVEPRSRKLLERSHTAFPDLETYTDGYLALTHCHVCNLELKIEEFIEETAQHDAAQDGESAAATSLPVS